MSQSCEKHAALPVVGHSPCAGCEIERLRRNRDMWKGQVERQAEELTSLRTEIAEWKDTVKFNEKCWSEERGTMIDKLQSARAEIEALRKDSVRWKWLEGKADSATWENIGYQEQMNRHLHVDAAMSKDPLANPGQ